MNENKTRRKEIVFVTGASAGFGEEIASHFLDKGWKVVASARRVERLKKLQAKAGKNASNLFTGLLDVSDKEAVKNFVGALPPEFAEVSVLVNNAGLAQGLSDAHTRYDTQLEDWETMVRTNINGVLYVTHALLSGMVARGRGHVVNIGSIAGTYPYRGGNVYGATKAFLKQFSLNLKADLLGTPVRVTNIEPGMAETEFSLVRFKGDADKAGSVYKGTKPLTSADIANAVAWCVEQPAHVNINSIEIMPTAQAFGAFAVDRK